MKRKLIETHLKEERPKSDNVSCELRAFTQASNADLLTGDTFPLYNQSVPTFSPVTGSTPVEMLLKPGVYTGW